MTSKQNQQHLGKPSLRCKDQMADGDTPSKSVGVHISHNTLAGVFLLEKIMDRKVSKYLQLVFVIVLLVIAAWRRNECAVFLAFISILFTVRFHV